MAATSLNEKRAEYAALLDSFVEALVRKLRGMEDVTRISLFGSYPRGRRDLLTDLDVIVVMETEESFVERLRRLYGALTPPVDVDIFCYTPAEFRVLREEGWLRTALEGEVVLYETEPGGGGKTLA